MKKILILAIFSFGIQNSVLAMNKGGMNRSIKSVRNLSSLSLSIDEKKQIAQDLFEKGYRKDVIRQWLDGYFVEGLKINNMMYLEDIFKKITNDYFDKRYLEFNMIFIETCLKELSDNDLEDILEFLEKNPNAFDKIQLYINFNERLGKYLTNVFNSIVEMHSNEESIKRSKSNQKNSRCC